MLKTSLYPEHCFLRDLKLEENRKDKGAQAYNYRPSGIIDFTSKNNFGTFMFISFR